ncbi:MAG: hypothetical protein Q4A56_06415 [Porphyromonadaceae bacterium]|nr:hypothetical protein [Porphyromonadaceae bacterium]
MNKLQEKKYRILRWIYATFCLGSVVFIFQACYGMPKDFGKDVKVTGIVKSKSTNQPIKGIKVIDKHSSAYQKTDSNGNFSMYVSSRNSGVSISFMDVDSTENGSFLKKDTIVAVDNKRSIELDIRLEDAK